MSVKRDPETGLWKYDFRANGVRFRGVKETREEARDFENTTKATARLGVAVFEQSGKPLDESISEFVQLETIKKESAPDEKAFLGEFYRHMVHGIGLTMITEIRLIHLNKHQAYLQSSEERVRIWDLTAKAHRKQFEESKAKGEAYLPLRKPRSLIGLSPSSVNRHMNSISDLLAWAKKWDWISVNPSAELEPLEEFPAEGRPWPSNKAIQDTIDKLPAWAARPTFFIAKTGSRSVGAKRLRWSSDVDFENRMVKITSKKGRNGATKEHWIPMTGDLYEFFVFMWNNRHVGEYSDLVFHSISGLPLDTKGLGREVAVATKGTDYEGCTLRGMRHFVGATATNPSEDGKRAGNIEHARLMLGHAKVTQTQRYTRTDISVLRKQMEIIDGERNLVWRKG